MVHNKTAKLAVLFVLVGVMMIVVPILTEQAYARTTGAARTYACCTGSGPSFTNVKGHLDAGKWVKFPTLVHHGHEIQWVTAGRGIFAGDEKGTITADYGSAHVTFFWSNPDGGINTCKTSWTAGTLRVSLCKIVPHQESVAYADYTVSVSCYQGSSSCGCGVRGGELGEVGPTRCNRN